MILMLQNIPESLSQQKLQAARSKVAQIPKFYGIRSKKERNIYNRKS